jgi:hypothetical protein
MKLKIHMLSIQIVAHMVGHNLGMKHDFGDTVNPIRRDSLGRSCTAIGGIMDYRTPQLWSTCSVEDFNAYHDDIVRTRGQFCLATDGTTTTAATTTTATTTTMSTSTECFDDARLCMYATAFCAISDFVSSRCQLSCGICS